MRKKLKDISDERLIQQFGKGRQEAFDELYQRYYSRLLYYIIQSIGLDEQEAKDVLQDVFVKVIRHADKFNPEYKFSTWIYTICNNTCKNLLKKREVESRYDISLWNNHEEKYSKEAASRQVRKALHTLPVKQKQVFLLRFHFDCSLKEIARILDISEGTVKSRLHYCLRNLSKLESLQSLNQES